PPEQPGEDAAEPPILPDQTDGSVVAKTMGVSSGVSYLRAGDLYVANRAQKQADVAALAGQTPDFSLSDGPQILILHSHGSEAYTPQGEEDSYLPSDPYRTTDLRYNVVRVGEEMAQVFRAAGFSVVHDTNLYDYPSYNGAYDRSLEAARRWLTQFPSLKVILDVHRDALGDEQTIYKTVSQQGQNTAAQVMLVVGTDNGGFHPLWQENLSFALQLQRRMLDDHGTLARPIVLRSSRFNQQLSVGSVLVEVGTHGNALDEALVGARLFAQSAVQVLTPLRAD
ncbi:MAG: stage II sporulation protein P, partial [Oscillospiraceae bacterium]|nr:stage II sporulation protein P [Oscillospiraceae bacterium]